ncbi:MAG: hypothetical protein ACK4V2_07165 [Pseudomonadota bacterium]|jgi:hypothetical protein
MFKKYFFITLSLFNFGVNASSLGDLSIEEIQEGRNFLARKLSADTVQKADDIRLEGVRVIKKLKSFNFLEQLPFLDFLGARLQYRLDNDPTLARIIDVFERSTCFSADLINLINITNIKSSPGAAGVIIGSEHETDYDLILGYVRDEITKLFPEAARRVLEENPGDPVEGLVRFLDIHKDSGKT